MRIAILAAVLSQAACGIQTNLIECANGLQCPGALVCDDAHASCALPEQLAVCEGAAQDASCATSEIESGTCREGVCLPRTCGNSYVDPGELCDDGNEQSGDGCHADCRSDERCGGGVVDLGEECDDGNLLSHDGCDSQCRDELAEWQQIAEIRMPRFASSAAAYDTLRHELVVLHGGFGPALTGGTLFWDGNAWRRLDPNARQPMPRRNAAMAYDSRRHQVVMFGGMGTESERSDTWIWDGERWNEHVDGKHPSPRQGHTIVYDPERDRVMLFGGKRSGVYPTDVWEWDGSEWAEVALDPTQSAPGLRFDHVATYDPTRRRIVVAGGSDDSAVALLDTWLWNGAWEPAAALPAPAVDASLTYSPILDAAVLAVDGITMQWDGTSWSTPIASPATMRRAHLSFFDPEHATTVIAGGLGDETLMKAVWMYRDGDAVPSWTAAAESYPPPPCAMPGLVYDPAVATIRMAGGLCGDPVNLTLVGSTWRRGPAVTGLPNIMAHSTYDSRRSVALVYSGVLFESDGTTWTRRTEPGPARSMASLGFDPVRGVSVLYGGLDSATIVGDTWTWDGETWREVDPGPIRIGHSVAFDTRRGKLVMFGGYDESRVGNADVWEWDGTWHRVEYSSTGPQPRQSCGMAFDEALGEVIVFGGDTNSASDSGTPLHDVWAWNGVRWREIYASNAPSAVSGVSMVYDPSRAAMFAVGGGIGVMRLRWESPEGRSDICDAGLDLDGDGLHGCADPDCNWACQ